MVALGILMWCLVFWTQWYSLRGNTSQPSFHPTYGKHGCTWLHNKITGSRKTSVLNLILQQEGIPVRTSHITLEVCENDYVSDSKVWNHFKKQTMIDRVDVLYPVMNVSGYVEWPCKGHEVVCLRLLLLKPNTEGNKRYENHRHKYRTIPLPRSYLHHNSISLWPRQIPTLTKPFTM